MLAKSFVFVRGKKYYIIYFDDRDVYIDVFRFDGNRVVADDVEEIVKNYFRFYANLSLKDKQKYIHWLNSLEFEVLDVDLPEGFINRFICDLDPYFLFQDRFAKHFELDFEAIKKGEKVFFKQPKLFPFYISYLDVWVMGDGKIYKQNQLLTPMEVFELDKKYKTSLIPLIKRKEKIYSFLTKRLIEDFYRQKSFLDSQKVCDYNLEMMVTIFDIAGNILFKIFYDESFEEGRYKLNFLELDVEVGTLLYWIINKFGIMAVTTKLNIWCEVKSDLQMFYKV